MSYLPTWIKEFFNHKDTVSGCHAVINKETGETCSNSKFGRGCSEGYELVYCKEHVPSNETPWSNRVDSIMFYVSEEETVIEVS